MFEPPCCTLRFAPRFNYFRRDHLGNVREVWHASVNAYCVATGNFAGQGGNFTTQRTQFMPSGVPWETSYGSRHVNNMLYQGKRLIEMHSLDWYDFHWRWYNPTIARTTTMDPLAHLFPSQSPYSWVRNNFPNRIDPDGRACFLGDHLDNWWGGRTQQNLRLSHSDAEFVARQRAVSQGDMIITGGALTAVGGAVALGIVAPVVAPFAKMAYHTTMYGVATAGIYTMKTGIKAGALAKGAYHATMYGVATAGINAIKTGTRAYQQTNQMLWTVEGALPTASKWTVPTIMGLGATDGLIRSVAGERIPHGVPYPIKNPIYQAPSKGVQTIFHIFRNWNE